MSDNPVWPEGVDDATREHITRLAHRRHEARERYFHLQAVNVARMGPVERALLDARSRLAFEELRAADEEYEAVVSRLARLLAGRPRPPQVIRRDDWLLDPSPAQE